MSSAYATVKQTIVDLLEATEPDDHESFVRGPFVHQTQGITESHVPDRGFSLVTEGGRAELPGCYQGKGRVTVQMLLAVRYKAVKEISSLDDVVISDTENLIAQLLKESNWNRPSSGIELIGNRESDLSSIPFDVVSDDEGGLTLVFTITVVYARGVETNTPTP